MLIYCAIQRVYLLKGVRMNFKEAKMKIFHEIHVQETKLKNLQDCLKYIENEENANDNMVQTPEQILNNFGIKC